MQEIVRSLNVFLGKAHIWGLELSGLASNGLTCPLNAEVEVNFWPVFSGCFFLPGCLENRKNS